MEIWDIYTKDKVKTGRTGIRGEKLDNGDYHLLVFAFLVNPKNEILISRRTMNKTFPGCWEITGGSAISGDTSEMAVLREIKEELGIEVDLNNGHIIKRHIGKSYASYIAETYIFFEDININDVVCQQEEVSEAKYVTIAEFHQMLKEGLFTPNTFIYEPLYQVLVESYFYSWLKGDVERFNQLLHEDIVVEECTGDMYIGKKACQTWFKTWNQPGNKVNKWTISKTLSGYMNKEVVVEWNFDCDFEYKSYNFDGCSIVEFKDHKILSIKEYQMNTIKHLPYNK